jgi:hypothetical protein
MPFVAGYNGSFVSWLGTTRDTGASTVEKDGSIAGLRSWQIISELVNY